MKKKYYLSLSLFFIILSISVVAAENVETNTTIEDQDNIHIEKVENGLNDFNETCQDNVNNKKIVKHQNNTIKEKVDHWPMVISPYTGYAGNTTELLVTLTNESITGNVTGSFDYYFNNIFIGNSIIKNNTSKFKYIIPENYEGEYLINATHRDENNKLTNHSVYNSMDVLSKDTIMVDTNIGNYFAIDKTKQINVYLHDIKGNLLNKNGKISFNLHYPEYHNPMLAVKKIGDFKVKNGKSSFKFKISYDEFLTWDTEYYPLLTVFEIKYHDKKDNKDYFFDEYVNLADYYDILPYWSCVSSDLKPVPTFITGNSIIGYNGQNITFKGSVIDEYNTPVTEGRIIVKLNGKTIKSNLKLKNSNKFTYNYTIPENMSKKKYIISYVFAGTQNYNRSETYKTLTITKQPVKIITKNITCYAGQKIKIQGSITDIKNKPVNGGKIVIKLNGKTIESKNISNKTNKFTYKYTIPPYQPKKYNITFVYINDKYQRTQLNNKLTIKAQKSMIQVKNITAHKNETIHLTIKIKGQKTDIPSIKGNVGFKINGKTVKIKGKPFIQKIKNGSVTFNYKIPNSLKEGKHKLTITYSGGRYLQKSITDAYLIVKND